ncbi:hypothetical protein O3G_MSEX014887 [Manduca sexta]|uniref:Uncharacterized protein n=1 Tax=Manduca sexta TaxID=7130 RepID=A0A921ZXF9_MANSE|nr:hypothetical protein O3G_MSEX014887 [Manduca sexta]
MDCRGGVFVLQYDCAENTEVLGSIPGSGSDRYWIFLLSMNYQPKVWNLWPIYVYSAWGARTRLCVCARVCVCARMSVRARVCARTCVCARVCVIVCVRARVQKLSLNIKIKYPH